MMSKQLVKIECCRAKDGCPRALDNPSGLFPHINEILNKTNYAAKRQALLKSNHKNHHIFKISLAGCPNCCSQPQIKDFGAYKLIYPQISNEKCTLCQNCIDECQENAIYCHNDQVIIDLDKCIGCAKCINACTFEAISAHKEQWRVIAGGKLGKRPQLAVKLADIAKEEEIKPYLQEILELHLQSKNPHIRLGDLLEVEKYDLNALPIGKFLKKVNSSKPYPSGGSSLAVVAGIGVSLLGMGIKISAKKSENHPPAQLFITKTEDISKELLEFAKEDINNVADFFSSKKDTVNLMDSVLKIPQILVPLLKEYLDNYYPYCYTPVKGDADAGLGLLNACIKESLHLCEINLLLINEEKIFYYKKELHKLKRSHEK